MMKFSDRYTFGCDDKECVIFIHSTILLPALTNEIGVTYDEVQMHRDIHAVYYINRTGQRVNVERDE